MPRRNNDKPNEPRSASDPPQGMGTRERLLTNAQRIANLGSWELDIESNRLLWSDQIFEIFGVAPEDFSSTYEAFLALVHPEDRAAFEASQQAVLRGERNLDVTHRIVRPDGEVRYVHELGELELREGGHVLVGTVHDVTRSYRAEENAREAARMLELASRAARLGGWRIDLASNEVEWTDETAAIHDEPPGTRLTLDEGIRYFAPEYRERILALFRACAERGQPYDETLEIVTARGRRLWVRAIGEPERDGDGRIVAVRGAFQDVSELVAARQESSRLSQQLLETFGRIRDAFLLLDRDWCVRFVNRQAEILLARDANELVGRDVWKEFPEAVGSTFETQYSYALEHDEPVSFVEYFGPLETWFSVDAYPTREGLAIYFSDITQLRLLEMAVSRLNDIVVITEGRPLDEPGPRILYVNEAFERRTGYTRDDVIGRSPRLLQGPKTQREELDRIRSALEAGEAVRTELVNYTKAGREFWLELEIVPLLNEAGEHSHSVAVQRDVTKRRRNEIEKQLSEDRFRVVAQATTDVIFDFDLVRSRVWWSEGLCTQFGYEPQDRESETSPWVERVHPDDYERVVAGVHAVIDGDAERWQCEYRFRRADGTYSEVVGRGAALRDAQGQALRFVGCLVDVTEQRRLEAQLRQAQRLEAVGQLTGGVAHDFNNLLTVILGNSDLVLEAVGDDAGIVADVDMIKAAAQRGAELTTRLLAFSRRQPLEPRATDVETLIAEMDALLRRTLGEHIQLEVFHADGLSSALVDPAQLESAILNLCLNARDAMSAGDMLKIEVGNRSLDADDASVFEDVLPGDYVVVSVVDTGHGMDEKTAARAFEPFFTTKDVQSGSGLGLSMVWGFAKQSRGHARIVSVPGEGTRVDLFLPRAGDAELASEAVETRQLAHAGSERVLVVEDERMVRDFVRGQLLRLGYRVEAVENGLEAIEAVRNDGPYDLLFTDVVLPGGMDGSELADTACRLQPGLRVLFTSGYTQDALVQGGRLEPGVRLLTKPYGRDALGARVREVLDAASE